MNCWPFSTQLSNIRNQQVQMRQHSFAMTQQNDAVEVTAACTARPGPEPRRQKTADALQAVRRAENIFGKEKQKMIADFAPDKKVRSKHSSTALPIWCRVNTPTDGVNLLAL